MRPITMRRSSLTLAATLLAFALPLNASASCAGPYLDVTERSVLPRGSTVTIEGRFFTDGCQDSMSCPAMGCGSCESDDPAPRPMQDVELILAQGERTWDLSVADASTAESSQPGRVTWVVDLPAGVRPGPAKLLPEHAEPVRVRIR